MKITVVFQTTKTSATTGSIIDFVITSVSELYLFVLIGMFKFSEKSTMFIVKKRNFASPWHLYPSKFSMEISICIKYRFLELMSRNQTWHFERHIIPDDTWRNPGRQMLRESMLTVKRWWRYRKSHQTVESRSYLILHLKKKMEKDQLSTQILF